MNSHTFLPYRGTSWNHRIQENTYCQAKEDRGNEVIVLIGVEVSLPIQPARETLYQEEIHKLIQSDNIVNVVVMDVVNIKEAFLLNLGNYLYILSSSAITTR